MGEGGGGVGVGGVGGRHGGRQAKVVGCPPTHPPNPLSNLPTAMPPWEAGMQAQCSLSPGVGAM